MIFDDFIKRVREVAEKATERPYSESASLIFVNDKGEPCEGGGELKIDQLIKQNEVMKEALGKYTKDKWDEVDVGAQSDFVLKNDGVYGFEPSVFAEEALKEVERIENENR